MAGDVPGFLMHGGVMGALLSAREWDGTVLGPPGSWPSSLKTMLATVLSNPQPMIMGWGPDLLAFFNDGYRNMVDGRFDGLEGRPAAEVWAAIWPQIAPILKKTQSGVGSHYENMPLTVLRNGNKTHTWWTFSFMPFRTETGAIAGLYCLSTETTEKVLAEQRKALDQKQQAFRLELAEALRDALTPEVLMGIAAEKLGVHLQAACVGYAEIDETGEWSRVLHNWTRGDFCSMVGAYRLADLSPLMTTEFHAGRTVVVNDTNTDPLTAGKAFRDAYRSSGKQAFIDAPLIKDGRLAAILFVINAAPRAWLDSEKALVEEVAERTWASLQRLQSELDLRQANRVLDQRTGELLRSETALRQSQKLEALGQLTGGVAHDFNNLLAVISSSVELLRSDRLPEAERGRYLDLIFDTVGRGAKLTSQLLAFARKQPLSPEIFDVDLQVQGVVDFVRPLMGAQVQIRHEACDGNGCFIEADISQFENALINLAINARDAMDARGELTIRVHGVDSVPPGPGRSQRSGAFVAVSVADTGCGIPGDKLEMIFEPFYTTKEVGKGTGLGLSQVFGFTKQSGGEVEVRSTPGTGSAFTLYLPRAGKAAPQAAADPLENCPDGHALSVLIVEDNETLAQMTREILSALGYRVAWAANAAAALDLLAEDRGRFELVFSDVLMPGMNGIEFGELVRARYPGLAVVLTSGYSADMAEQGQHGFKLVVKPYTSDTLAGVFRKAMAELQA
ncbi:MAG: sensor hybrid histidine kinase [Polaromonas sp.]|nr:sensor hybrid histidine kinase [Polaromonas sp.]